MVSQIMNFYAYNDRLLAGGQPTPEQIKALKDKGVETILCISPVSTPNFLSTEAQLAEQLDLEFIHYPVDCSNLKDDHYVTFSSILKGLESKKLFIHCGGNIKTSNLVHMYNVLEKGISEEDSVKELKKIQQPEEKWFSYFRKMGMQGVS